MPESAIQVICILGPTAAGKTRLAARVAAALPGEVISADSRQVYRRMDVGTGKDLDDYVVDGRSVARHLIDVVDPGHEYSVFEYKRDCVAAIRDVYERKRIPVLCGGSGMYLSAILQDYRLLSAPPDPKRRAELESMSKDSLVRELCTHGPLHNTSDVNDLARLVRAIEIAEADPSDVCPSVVLDAQVYGVHWERDELRRRISRRLSERLEQGMVAEVRGLLEGGLTPEQLMFYGLEYRHVTEHVLGRIDRARMFDRLEAAIHRLAKRQRTWFRRMERQGVSIRWLDGRIDLQENVRTILDGFVA